MKVILEVLLSIFLHPIAFILCLINIAGRRDLGMLQKAVWMIVTFFWGIGPILYVMLGGGELW